MGKQKAWRNVELSKNLVRHLVRWVARLKHFQCLYEYGLYSYPCDIYPRLLYDMFFLMCCLKSKITHKIASQEMEGGKPIQVHRSTMEDNYKNNTLNKNYTYQLRKMECSKWKVFQEFPI